MSDGGAFSRRGRTGEGLLPGPKYETLPAAAALCEPYGNHGAVTQHKSYQVLIAGRVAQRYAQSASLRGFSLVVIGASNPGVIVGRQQHPVNLQPARRSHEAFSGRAETPRR